MVRATDIHSLTDFTRNARSFVNQIKDTKHPIALTVNGDAQVVVQDAETYQQMVDELDRARLVAAIRESEKAVAEGKVKDVDEAFAQIRKNLGL